VEAMAGEELKTSSLSQTLLDAVRSAVQLQITTQVGSGDGNAISTSINLVQGDITNNVPEKFWAPDQQIVRDFHQAQIEQAKAIVERNLKMIAEVGKQIADAITELKRAEKS
jgi:hypothetical protein